MTSELSVIRYPTLLDCIAEFLGCDPDQVENQDGIWQWADAEGDSHEQSMKDAINKILNENLVWAWMEDKHILHIWFSDKAMPEDILSVLAHEIGHSRRPFHRDTFREEQKASQYAIVALMAFRSMNDLIEKEAK